VYRQFDVEEEEVGEKIPYQIEGLERAPSNAVGIGKMRPAILLLIRNALAVLEKVLLTHSALAEREMVPLIHSRVYSVKALVVYCRERFSDSSKGCLASGGLPVSMLLYLVRSMLERVFERLSILPSAEEGSDLANDLGISWLV
jgi:hypothetical protein